MLALAMCGLAGCQRDSIAVYEVPHSDPHAGHNHDDPAQAHASPHSSGPMESPSWTLPEGWIESGASDMLAGRIRIPGPDGNAAEVAIMPFKRMNELDFLNVLRASLQLQPVSTDALPSMVESIQIGEEQGQLFDVTKDATSDPLPEDMHVLVAMLARGDTSWFFKLSGDASMVAANRTTFAAFLKSVTFTQAAPRAVPAATASAPGRHLPVWDVPEHWKELPATTMLLAKFQLSDSDGGTAEVTVSSLGGDGGGLLGNINRWRGQVGMPAITSDQLPEAVTSLDLLEGTASIVDVTGPGAEGEERRLVVVVHPHGGQTWYYKMMGRAGLVGAEKESLIQFVKSIRHNGA